jgi:hypothetical protein
VRITRHYYSTDNIHEPPGFHDFHNYERGIS